MTTPIQPVISVAASAPTAWFALAAVGDTAFDVQRDQREGLDGVPDAEALTILQQLRGQSPAQRNALVSALSEGQLCALRGLGPEGLSFGEQGELFDLLASSLDGHNLARVGAVYLHSAAASLWGDSLCRRASADATLAFLKTWAPRIEAAPSSLEVAAVGGDTVSSAVSLLAAKALAGLANHTRQVDEVLQLLAPHPSEARRLQSVIGAAQQMHVSVPACPWGGVTAVTCDPEPLLRLIDASACATSPCAKASVFEASAQLLGKMAVGRSAVPGLVARQGVNAALAQSLTRLVCSDTAGILGALETHHGGGQGLAAYVREMVHRGRTNELRVMTEQLRCGHDACEDPVRHFNQHDAQGRYRHAATLGYYVGAVQAACQVFSSEMAPWAHPLAAIFAGGLPGGQGMEGKLWLSGGAVRALQRVAASPPLALGAPVVERLTRALKAGPQDDAVTALVLPHAAEGGPVEKKEAAIACVAAMRRVINAHGL